MEKFRAGNWKSNQIKPKQRNSEQTKKNKLTSLKWGKVDDVFSSHVTFTEDDSCVINSRWAHVAAVCVCQGGDQQSREIRDTIKFLKGFSEEMRRRTPDRWSSRQNRDWVWLNYVFWWFSDSTVKFPTEEAQKTPKLWRKVTSGDAQLVLGTNSVNEMKPSVSCSRTVQDEDTKFIIFSSGYFRLSLKNLIYLLGTIYVTISSM